MTLKSLTIALSTLGLVGSSTAANLVSNGGFELSSNGPGFQFDSFTQATDWSSPGNAYNFLLAPGTADTTGATGEYGFLNFWGQNSGGPDFIPATSPAGGNFVAADGAFQTVAISQTISGLTPGDTYDVSFWWAAGQQTGFSGDTTDAWLVSLGAETQATATINLPNHGFSGWMQEVFTFTANNTSEVLSFLAVGTPQGVPPFAFLDGVSLTESAVPETAASPMMFLGLAAAAGLAARRRRGQ